MIKLPSLQVLAAARHFASLHTRVKTQVLVISGGKIICPVVGFNLHTLREHLKHEIL